MNLLIDIGNSRIKWRAAEQRRLQLGDAVPRGGQDALQRLETAWSMLPAPDTVLATSVADPASHADLQALVSRLWRRDMQFLTSLPEQLGVRNAYPIPGNLGPDRWAALLGAWVRGLAPCCIVDAGTAVTIDVLDGTGQHRGGMIFAGLGLSRRALTERAHRLPPIVDGDLPPLATDTVEAIRLGTTEALIGAVARGVQRCRQQHRDLRLLVTGGDAALLVGSLPELEPQLHPDLVFQGLAAVAEEGG